ncbi:M48 family metallopeptidase [Halopiger djelfimassiliensis]|uniref:M48 family metallopeptidase n=1 Tax=Halopiger djelfimassiliensis TaxID=1293047 RepID=UPI000677CD87|nr:M48 family metalloprotease [Halopiger djelfimassiliensis]
MTVACFALLLVTSALVALEALVIGVIVYGAVSYTAAGLETIGTSRPLAVALASLLVPAASGVAWWLARAVRAASDSDGTELREVKLRVLLLASMVTASMFPLPSSPAVRFALVALALVYLGWWFVTELDAAWPPEQNERPREPDVAEELGRRVGRLEAGITPRSIALAVAAAAAVGGGVFAAIAAGGLEPRQVVFGFAATCSLGTVGVHHGRTARSEFDDAAVLRELEDEFGPWVDLDAAGRADLTDRVRRLAARADVPAPDVRLTDARTPVAATVGYRPAASTIVLSSGLLERLDDRELDAVVAHELAHLGNRDAAVLTLLSFPAASARETIARHERNPFMAFPGHVVIATSRLCAAFVARAREYAADDGAVAITGTPAALASALETLAPDTAERPGADLRTVSGSAVAFSIVPPPWDERRFFDRTKRFVFRRLLGTHPPTERRLERLETRLRE